MKTTEGRKCFPAISNLPRLFLLSIVLFCPGMIHAQSLPSSSVPLNSWSFYDTNTWASDFGYVPISFNNLVSSNLADNTVIVVDNTNAAWLNYNVYESDGTTNLTVDHGTLTFWFAPNWSSASQGGFGPGQWGRLLEVGSYTPDSSFGWWSLYLDDQGSTIYFSAQTNSGDSSLATYLSAPVGWNTNEWHFVALTYSATNSALYLDGAFVTNGLPVTTWPGLDVLTNGFWIGSDSNGMTQAHGMFDDINTYNVPLDAGAIGDLYDLYHIDPTIGLSFFAQIASAPSSSPAPPTLDAITGAGFLQFVGNANTCVTSNRVWFANMLCALTGPVTNQAATFTFTIEGGSNGLFYDVFASAALAGTNSQWAWMGQGTNCTTYMLTNLPAPAAFLILGTPQDTDADGLTDAFERLVSHTDPNSPDTIGDGLSDLYKVLYGLPVNTIVPVPSLSSITVSKCAVP